MTTTIAAIITNIRLLLLNPRVIINNIIAIIIIHGAQVNETQTQTQVNDTTKNNSTLMGRFYSVEIEQENIEKGKEFLNYPLYVRGVTPLEVNSTLYYQSVIETIEPIFTIPPDGSTIFEDESGEQFTIYWWEPESLEPVVAGETELNATFSNIVKRKATYTTLNDSYPIDNSSLPQEVLNCLKETSQYDFSSPIIQELAAELSGNTNTVYGVCSNLIQWFYENVQYEGDYNVGWNSTASEIIDARGGVCNMQAKASVALLRSLGIPARAITIEYPPHARIQVFYPSVGWVNHDPTWNTLEPPSYSIDMEYIEESPRSWKVPYYGGYFLGQMGYTQLGDTEEHFYEWSPSEPQYFPSDGEILRARKSRISLSSQQWLHGQSVPITRLSSQLSAYPIHATLKTWIGVGAYLCA